MNTAQLKCSSSQYFIHLDHTVLYHFFKLIGNIELSINIASQLCLLFLFTFCFCFFYIETIGIGSVGAKSPKQNITHSITHQPPSA